MEDVMKEEKKVHDSVFIGRALEILKILQSQTDECTTITQPEIRELMKEHYCSERTLTEYLKGLMKELNPEAEDGYVEAGVTIDDYKIIPKGLEEKLEARNLGLKSEGAKKLQLRSLRYNQLFSFEELNKVIESVLFLKNIDDETKIKLIKKLQTLSSVNYPKHSPFISETTGKISKNIAGVFEDSRVDECVIRNNLTHIRKAIEAEKGVGNKISFHFNGYDENKKLIPRVDENGDLITYIVSPYYVILYNGKYYLVCGVEPYDNVSIYRIDLMSDISEKVKESLINKDIKISEKRRPKKEVKGLPENWNDNIASQFQTEHMYMFYGTPEVIALKLDRNRYTLLHDFFGDHYTFKRHIDKQWDEVVVKCVPKAMISWVMQCSDYVEVLEPQEIRECIREKCEELCKRYS